MRTARSPGERPPCRSRPSRPLRVSLTGEVVCAVRPEPAPPPATKPPRQSVRRGGFSVLDTVQIVRPGIAASRGGRRQSRARPGSAGACRTAAALDHFAPRTRAL